MSTLRIVQTEAVPLRLTDRDDDALMALSKQNHQAAFSVLLERHTGRVTAFSSKYLGDRALADDACQTTFLRLWKMRTTYEAQGLFRAFLSRLALNACRELSRSRKRRNLALERFAFQMDEKKTDVCEERILRREREQRVEAVVSRLPWRLKEAVLLRFFSDLSYAEMSRVLGRSEGALRSRVHQAIKKLEPNLKALDL